MDHVLPDFASTFVTPDFKCAQAAQQRPAWRAARARAAAAGRSNAGRSARPPSTGRSAPASWTRYEAPGKVAPARRDCTKGPMGRAGAGPATATRGPPHAQKGARGAAIDGSGGDGLAARTCESEAPGLAAAAWRDFAKGLTGRAGAGPATATRGPPHARKGARGAAIDGSGGDGLAARTCESEAPGLAAAARRDCAKGPMGRDGAGPATAMRGLLHARKGARGAAIDGLRLAMLAAPQQDGAQQGVLYCVSAVSQKRAFSVAISVRLYPIIRVATLLVQCTRVPKLG